jgi:hypothetical protein
VAVRVRSGRQRLSVFGNGKTAGADLGQTDGNMAFHATKDADHRKMGGGDLRKLRRGTTCVQSEA